MSLFRAIALSVVLFSAVASAAAETESMATAVSPGMGVPAEWTLGGAIAIGGGAAAPGVQGGVALAPFDGMPLYIGVEGGLFTQFSPFGFLVTVFPQAYWKFQATRSVQPKIGAGFGPVLATPKTRETLSIGGYVMGGVDVAFDADTTVHFVPKLGWFGPSIEFIPQIGVTVAL